jgi:hypothetical protein
MEPTDHDRNIASTFHQLRQACENRRRIALGRRRLTDGERDFALRLGKARQRVQQQKYLQAAIAKVFCDRR